MNRLLEFLTSENTLVLRAKKVIKAAIPDRILSGIKRHYYLLLIRASSRLSEDDTRAIALLAQPGAFVVDAGAFVGFYTKFLSDLVGPLGQVWAFEPMPETFGILSSNVRRLGLTNVRIDNCALSDREGTVLMDVPRFTKIGKSMYDARIVDDHQTANRFTRVACRPLDSVLRENDRPLTFIKIDVEGHELQCIMGALRTIHKWKPALMVETLQSVHEEGTPPHAIARLLSAEGYAACTYESSRFRRIESGQCPQDTFFLTPVHLSITS